MKKIILTCLFLLSLCLPLSAQTVKKDMHMAFLAFEQLQVYLTSEARFSNSKSEKEIDKLLQQLQESFVAAKQERTEYTRHAGFSASLDVISDRLADARTRFSEGNKGYAYYRLKNVGDYCLTCHSTFASSKTFATDPKRITKLSEAERAEFYLATRQYEQALPLLFKSVSSATNPRQRMARIRSWLVVLIRGFEDPKMALMELKRINQAVKLTTYEREEIAGFISSFERWQKEGSSEVSQLKKAENLIRQALGMNDPLTGRRGAVELLRASGILHKLMLSQDGLYIDKRGHMLYLLGLSYSRLPLFFVNELPDMFLEQCIREYPNTRDARECFRLYSNNVQIGYTGSAGTNIPSDIEERLADFYALAYGSKP